MEESLLLNDIPKFSDTFFREYIPFINSFCDKIEDLNYFNDSLEKFRVSPDSVTGETFEEVFGEKCYMLDLYVRVCNGTFVSSEELERIAKSLEETEWLSCPAAIEITGKILERKDGWKYVKGLKTCSEVALISATMKSYEE